MDPRPWVRNVPPSPAQSEARCFERLGQVLKPSGFVQSGSRSSIAVFNLNIKETRMSSGPRSEEYVVLCHGWLPRRGPVTALVHTLQGGFTDYSRVTGEGRVACSRHSANKPRFSNNAMHRVTRCGYFSSLISSLFVLFQPSLTTRGSATTTVQQPLTFQLHRFRNHIPLPPVQQLRFSNYDSGLVFKFIYIGFISGLFWVGLGLFKVGLGLVYGLCEFIEGFPLVVEPDVPLKPLCKYVPFSFQV